MGVVYRATQPGLDRQVALKVIAAEFADNLDFRNRFKSEAQLAASIDHPNVVPIFETGESDGTLYLAMRFVEGTDLRTLVESPGRPRRRARGPDHLAGRRGARRRPPPRPRPPRRQAAERADRPRGRRARLPDRLRPHEARRRGGRRLHAHGPLRRHAGLRRARSRSAASRPTPAPTSTRSAPCSSTPSPGRVPFPRDSELAKMYAHLNDPAPAASPLARPGTPTGLDAVIGTAMAKDPAERYESAGDLARAAWAALQGEVMPGAHGQRRHRPRRRSRRRSRPTRPRRARRPPSRSLPPPPTARPVRRPRPPLPAHRPRRRSGRRGPRAGRKGRRIALLAPLPVLLDRGGSPWSCSAGGGDDKDGGADAAAVQPPAKTAEPPAGEAQGQARVVNTIKVGDGPDGIAADGKRIFVSHAKDGTLREIDADLDQVVGEPVAGRARTPTRSRPARARCGSSTRRATSCSGSRASRRCSRPRRIPIGKDAQGISLGVQLAWVANTGDDTVQRDRPRAGRDGRRPDRRRRPPDRHLRRLEGVGDELQATGRCRRSTSPPPRSRAHRCRPARGARGVTEGFGGVWVSNLHDDTVTRVDPETFEVVAQIPVGKRAEGARGRARLGLGRQQQARTPSPASTRGRTASPARPIPVGRNPIGITATKGAVWVTNFADDTVSAIKP